MSNGTRSWDVYYFSPSGAKFRSKAAVARVLDMKKTLDENGIPDETAAFDDLDIPDGYYVPTIHLYFSDDLTVA